MMIWKNDTGLPFTEIRRACCAAGGKTSESRKTWRIKGANGNRQPQEERAGLLKRRTRAWLPAGRPSSQAAPWKEKPAGGLSPVSQRPLETLEKLKELKKYNLEGETVQGSWCS